MNTTKVNNLVDMILPQTEKRREDKRLVVYCKKCTNEILPSHYFNDSCKNKVLDWLKSYKLRSEVANGIHRIDFDRDIFLFEVYEDEEEIILSGYEVKRSPNIRLHLLDIQANYLIKGIT